MSQSAGRDEIVERAVELARDVGPDIVSVLLTDYPDAETLDTIRPGGLDLETQRAVNRAVAAEMLAQGVEVFVQRADRAAFRRWLAGREDTAEARLAWIDRGRVLRGPAALAALGLDPVAPAPAPRFAKAPGPIADSLVAAFAAEESDDDFEELANGLLEAGRGDVLDLALRKMEERFGEEAADDLAVALLDAAEGARLGPSGWAELVALPVALGEGAPPDAVKLTTSMLAAEVAEETAELRFLPGWRSPDALAELPPVALRRVLLDLIAGTEPRDLPPGDTDELAERGFGLLLGLRIEWSIPIWEQIAEEGGLPEPEEPDDAEQTPAEARSALLFDRWRSAAFEAFGGCVPIALLRPSEVAGEIAEFLEEAGEQTEGLAEINDFVAVARREAGSDDVVCRVEVVGEDLELSLYTERGRFLDSLTLGAERLPAPAEEMPRLIEAFVRVVKDAPGR